MKVFIIATVCAALIAAWMIGCAIADARRKPRVLEDRLAHAIRTTGSRSAETAAALAELESWKRHELG